MSGAQRRLPAELSAEKTQEIQSLAVDAFRAIGCSGVVRVDFLMDTDDGDKVYINELNTIPARSPFISLRLRGCPMRSCSTGSSTWPSSVSVSATA